MDTDAIAASLDLFAARTGDPAPLVYAWLFARHPEAEALFLLDHGGQVRGQMLAMVFEALLEDAADGRLGGLVAIERLNHVNIGVPAALFDGFLALLRDLVRNTLGAAWTPAMDTAWRARIAALAPPG